MRRLFVMGIVCFPSLCTSRSSDEHFNKGWLFYRGEVDAKSVTYDDGSWEKVTLPHDWAIAGPFSDKNNARTGGLPVTGMAWYRKHFRVDAKHAGKVVSIEFDGAMSDAYVWVNGELVGNRPFGYLGFEFEITKQIKFGAENVIAVRLNPEDLSQRWYPGAGLYRPVRIKYNHKVHLAHWGTFITTPLVTDDKAVVAIETKVQNPNELGKKMLTTQIKNSKGDVVAEVTDEINGPVINQKITVKKPERWDIDNPYLYTAVSKISVSGTVVDEYTTSFGIRTIAFTPNAGFHLNGRRVQLNGVCMHHDLGPLGAAVNYRARERQMQIMQRMGVNALRTSHNPPEPEWLDICDRLGIVVIDEAFDEWKIGKVPNGYNKHFDKWHEKDLRDMIKRDRNHPSVILWSTGNEIKEQSDRSGGTIARQLTEICHNEDPTRLVTAGFNAGMKAYKHGVAQAMDVVGFNYRPFEYHKAKERDPKVIIYGSETSSQTSSRGVYHMSIERMPRKSTGHVSSYDCIVGPSWAYPPDIEFMQQKKNPYSLGEFIWTGFDYLGEPTPYGGRDNSTHGYWNDDWPSHSSYFAPVDLVGLPKDRFFLYQSQWTTKPMVHVLPHWNWEGTGHKKIPVFAYTNAEEVELFVNGKSHGKKVKGVDKVTIPVQCWGYCSRKDTTATLASPYRLSWNVPYEPGTLKVVAYTGGRVVAEEEVRTAGTPAGIKLKTDRKAIKADGLDMAFVTVTIVDKNGVPCPKAENLVTFKVEGGGFNAGVGNGNQRCLLSMKGNEMTAFSGQLVLYVQSKEFAKDISIVAQADGLKAATLTLKAE